MVNYIHYIANLDGNSSLNQTERELFKTIELIVSDQINDKASYEFKAKCLQVAEDLVEERTFTLPMELQQEKEVLKRARKTLSNITGSKSKPASPTDGLVLQDINGQDISLDSYFDQGKIVVFAFWATWCAPCIKEIPELNELASLYPDQVTVVSIAHEEAKRLKPGLIQMKGNNLETPEYDILVDPDRAAYKKLVGNKGNGIPYILFYTEDGKLKNSIRGALTEERLIINTAEELI